MSHPNPHFYVCVKKETEYVWFMCCTSQRDASITRILKQREELDTLVHIADAADGPFNKPTYIDCNRAEMLDVTEIKALYENGTIEFKGYELPDEKFRLLINGILLSNKVEKRLQKLLMPIC